MDDQSEYSNIYNKIQEAERNLNELMFGITVKTSLNIKYPYFQNIHQFYLYNIYDSMIVDRKKRNPDIHPSKGEIKTEKIKLHGYIHLKFEEKYLAFNKENGEIEYIDKTDITESKKVDYAFDFEIFGLDNCYADITDKDPVCFCVTIH